jgi:hypothetical protein
VCACVCACVFACVHMRACASVCVRVRVCVLYVYVRLCVRVSVCVHAYACVRDPELCKPILQLQANNYLRSLQFITQHYARVRHYHDRYRHDRHYHDRHRYDRHLHDRHRFNRHLHDRYCMVSQMFIASRKIIRHMLMHKPRYNVTGSICVDAYVFVQVRTHECTHALMSLIKKVITAGITHCNCRNRKCQPIKDARCSLGCK